MSIRDFSVFVKQAKRESSREDVATDLIAWSLMMWAWAADVGEGERAT